MKISNNKSVKKVLCLLIALTVLFGSLFTANVGISTNAATVDTNYSQWDGTFDTELEGFGTEEAPYLITSAAELAAVCYGKAIGSKTGAHFAVSGISEFYMDSVTDPATVKGFNSATEVRDYYSSIATAPTVWYPNTDVTLYFDGNNATIYGLYMNAAKGGLFSQVKQGSTIKNIAVKNSYANTTNYIGGLFAQAHWGTITSAIYVTNCIVRNNYFNSTSDAVGTISGHGAAVPHRIENCLAADNIIQKNGADVQYTYFVFYNDSVPAGQEYYFKNCIGIGSAPQFKYKSSNQAPIYENNYYSNAAVATAVDGVTKLADGGCKGVNGKINMSSLNWATDTTDGDWYAMKGDYPLPYKPDGWVDLEIPDVWDGTVATEFAGGTGTKDDPYIIKTASQLYKMVQDGGREVNGSKTYAKIYANTYKKDSNNQFIWEDRTNITVNTYKKCYYKVADGITDIYLNPIVEGTLDTLKSLVSAGKALNWTQDFNADIYMADSDKDGIRDQATAFRGEFDGNGVTIHGLYSTATNRTWNIEGVGFVPALMDDAVIKNVSFDKSYVYNKNYGMAAVITTSLGIDADSSVKDYDVDTEGNSEQMVNYTCAATASIGIHNVSVSNAYISAQQSAYSNTDVAGFVSTYGTPVALSFTNCLFDGTSCEFKVAGATPTYKAGIVSSPASTDHIYLENCVSIGEYPIPTAATKYEMKDCYTTEASLHSGITQVSTFDKNTMPNLNWTQWSIVDNKPVVTGISAAHNHATNWKESIAYTNESRWNLNHAASTMGNWTMSGAHDDGVYINYEDMQGSGTEADPYLISDALTLARVIGSGGKNYTQKLFFKLTNDINVGGLRWIDNEDYATDENGDGVLDAAKYSYRPFEGVLDGDGYAVTGLYANSESAGLISILDGGTVKNLHVRDAYIVSSTCGGVIAGEVYDNNPDDENYSTIENCSVEGATVSAADGYYDDLYFIGYDDIGDTEAFIINNSYFVGTNGSTYVIDDYYSPVTADEIKAEIIAGNKDYTSKWYLGADDSTLPQLISRAKAMPCADIDGDGNGYEYALADAVVLKNKLLKKKAYANIYGDVNKNGSVNSTDLVALTRALADDYDHIKDGFWRNVELGNMAIYYGENDNYDAARKLELALENAVSGVDIIKNASGSNTYVHTNDGTATPGSQLAIVVGNVGSYNTLLTGNNYGITYDKENAVLWIQGANFTGVEQAVLDFIAGSDAQTNKVYTVASATLSADKQPKTVGGTTYYYAWGDEFDVATSDDSLTKDVWEYGEMGTESRNDEFSHSSGWGNGSGYYKYHNLETANPDDLASLFEVKNGKLSIWRGIDKDSYNASTHSWGYKPVTLTDNSTTAWGAQVDSEDIYATAGVINTEKSLLFKQGYIEMKAKLPNDGHAFPAWWFMGNPGGGQNRTYDSSLYSKVYKLNNNWTGINAISGAYPNSYKYQLPTCTLEFDIVELMQDISYADEMGGSYFADERYSQLTGVYRTAFDLNIHKWYDENVENDKLYVIDWAANGNGGTIKDIFDLTAFNSSTAGSWTHRWNGTYYDFGSNSALGGEHTYGVAWNADESDNTFTVTVYVDGTAVMSMNQNAGYYESQENATLEESLNSKGGKVLNQYVHFLLDNHFYTYNQYYGFKSIGSNQSIGKAFTDLETQESGENATFTIDYVRIYQENDKRDIVTKETENFNNNNHFGYGE